MFASYRTHEEQLKVAAQKLNSILSITKSGDDSETRRNGPDSRSGYHVVEIGDDRTKSGPRLPLRRVPVPSSGSIARCIRCKDRISVMDFLYTEMTCLCISCWEEIFVI